MEIASNATAGIVESIDSASQGWETLKLYDASALVGSVCGPAAARLKTVSSHSQLRRR